MNRRPRLPGADELFRSTGGTASAQPLGPVSIAGVAAVDDPTPAQLARARRPDDGRGDGRSAELGSPDQAWDGDPDAPALRPVRIGRRSEARPTGRERHDEKITVYCSPEELLQIEQARLTLRGSHSLAVDRGRIVREAIAVVLADLEAKGESSILVRRLRGR
jgi:hypothetical protein